MHHHTQFVHLPFIHLSRRFGHQVGGPLGLGKRDTVADIVQSAEQHHKPVDPQRDAAVRRCTELQRIEQEAKPFFRRIAGRSPAGRTPAAESWNHGFGSCRRLLRNR